MSSTTRNRCPSYVRPVGLMVAMVGMLLPMAAPGRAAVLDARGIYSEMLPNGLKLIVAAEEDSPVVAAEVIVKVGSADEPAGQRGLAHLLEHALYAGAEGGEQDPRFQIERLGGVINGGTLRDYTRYYGTVPSGEFATLLQVLADITVRTPITASVVAREKRVIAAEVAGRSEDPIALLTELAFSELYGADTPYGSPLEGRAEQRDRLTLNDLKLFRERWYRPNNMAVVITGDISFADARAAVLARFGGLDPAPLPPRGTQSPPVSLIGRERRFSTTTVSRVYLMAVFLGPPAAEHRSVAASDLFALALAHDTVGRLTKVLREDRHLAQAVGVEFLTQRQPALFGLWVDCAPEQVTEVQATVRREVMALSRQSLPADEMETAKRLLAAGYVFANETAADRASTLAFYEAIDHYHSASAYPSWINDLSGYDLTRVASLYSVEPIWIVLSPEEENE